MGEVGEVGEVDSGAVVVGFEGARGVELAGAGGGGFRGGWSGPGWGRGAEGAVGDEVRGLEAGGELRTGQYSVLEVG